MTAFNNHSPLASPSPVDPPGVAAAEFKEVLARLASGLAIVSCWRDGRAEGLLVSPITGLSIDPPRFLFSVRREASAHEALTTAHVCGVNILSTDDEAAARAFMDPERRGDRFSGPGCSLEIGRPPLLMSALSASTCRVDTVIEGDGHSILVVTAQCLRRRSGQPLLSYNRGLHRLSVETV